MLYPHKTSGLDWQNMPGKKKTFWKNNGARGDTRFRSLNEPKKSVCVVHDDDDDYNEGDWNDYYGDRDGDDNGAQDNGK